MYRLKINSLKVLNIKVNQVRSYCSIRYTDHHQWVSFDGERGKMGMSYEANQRLGEIIYVELPSNGEKFKANQPIGTIQSSKAVCEIVSPINVEIEEVNTELKSAPEILNVDTPLFSFHSSDIEGFKKLMSKEEYDRFVSKENEMTKEKTSY